MTMRSKGFCLVVLVLAAVVANAYEDDYEYGYDSYEDDVYSYGDEYGYYGDDDENYYDYYGYYADDFAGYEDYYDEEDYSDGAEDCSVDAEGHVVLANGTATCDLKISGADKQADLLTGGIDGVYKLTSCHNGKPMYKRVSSPAGEERVLWFAKMFGDWDLSKGPEPTESGILLYGGEAEHAAVPMYVSNWHLSANYKTNSNLPEDDYLPISLTVTCADGKVPKAPETSVASVRKPQIAMTDDEIEKKYKIIYERYGKRPEPNPTVNFTFVVLLVMTGLTIVLAIPYFLLKKKGGKGSMTTGFGQLLQQNKKKVAGHYN